MRYYRWIGYVKRGSKVNSEPFIVGDIKQTFLNVAKNRLKLLYPNADMLVHKRVHIRETRKKRYGVYRVKGNKLIQLKKY